MKSLTIKCKGIANLSAFSTYIEVDIEEVDLDFIEDIKADDILYRLDKSDILDYIASNFRRDDFIQIGYIEE